MRVWFQYMFNIVQGHESAYFIIHTFIEIGKMGFLCGGCGDSMVVLQFNQRHYLYPFIPVSSASCSFFFIIIQLLVCICLGHDDLDKNAS